MFKLEFLPEATDAPRFGLRRLVRHEAVDARTRLGAFHCVSIAFSAAAEDFEAGWRRRRRRHGGRGRRDSRLDFSRKAAKERHVEQRPGLIEYSIREVEVMLCDV